MAATESSTSKASTESLSARLRWAMASLLAAAAANTAAAAAVCPPGLSPQQWRLHFAHGGRADFRGRQRQCYSIFSAPGLAVNARTEDAIFDLHDGKLEVNGSFITEAHLVARVGQSRQIWANLSYWASELETSWRQALNGTCGGQPLQVGERGTVWCEELAAQPFSSPQGGGANFTLGNWTIAVVGTEVPGWMAGPKHRLDISFRARGDAAAKALPHGLIGQSFTSGLPHYGKVDAYPEAGRFTTRAMAEGAIEGEAASYEVSSPHETHFTFSRFDAKPETWLNPALLADAVGSTSDAADPSQQQTAEEDAECSRAASRTSATSSRLLQGSPEGRTVILTANMSSSSASQLTRFDATSCELKNDIIGAMEGLGLAAPSSIVIKKLFDIGQASSDGFCSSSLGSGDTSCRTCPATAPTSPVKPPVYDSTTCVATQILSTRRLAAVDPWHSVEQVQPEGEAAVATCPFSGLCTGCPSEPPTLAVYVYTLPPNLTRGLDAPHAWYEGGYEQYATELAIPETFRRSVHNVEDPARADLFLVPFQGLLQYTLNKRAGAPQQTSEEFRALIDWLRHSGPWLDRNGGTDHIWIFPSGRGASIFPEWREYIGDAIFLSPEGDERTSLMQPRGKDIVIPGFRNVTRINPSLLARVDREAAAGSARPTFLYFRGSMASDRLGEENYGEGVRQRLEAALSSFQIPSHLRRARSLASAPGMDQEHIVFSSQAVTLPQYLDEMSRSDFCIVPLGSSTWTLRLYDAIFTGCVPVILSDHIALPFDERIDWSELAIKWRQADAERLPTFLLSLSSAQVAAKRKAILAARHNLAWCGTGGAFEQLVVALEERKRGLPRRSREEALPTSPASFWIEQPGDVDARVRETEHCTPSASWAPRPGRAAANQRTHDVVTIIPRPTCVLRTALQSLETRLQPRKVHLILDSCDGVELALADLRVRCVELDAAVPAFPVEAMTVPLARRYWYRQQLAKLAVASHEEVSETFYMWDGDTIALLDVMPTQMPDGRFPLLWGAPMDSPAHFAQTTDGGYSLPPGYRESTQALIGVAPTPNVSYVTQWQIWHKPFVLEMLGEIEQRTPEGVRWPEAVLAAASDHMQQGFSEYTLYGTWLLARHPQQVQLVSSHDVLWLRDPPSGLLDKAGECCPSSESLCQVALGGFHFVSWECSHASELRRPTAAAARKLEEEGHARRLELSPGPSAPPPPPSVSAKAFVEAEQLCGPLNDVPEGATLQAITIEIAQAQDGQSSLTDVAQRAIGGVAARALGEGISVAVSIVGA